MVVENLENTNVTQSCLVLLDNSTKLCPTIVEKLRAHLTPNTANKVGIWVGAKDLSTGENAELLAAAVDGFAPSKGRWLLSTTLDAIVPKAWLVVGMSTGVAGYFLVILEDFKTLVLGLEEFALVLFPTKLQPEAT